MATQWLISVRCVRRAHSTWKCTFTTLRCSAVYTHRLCSLVLSPSLPFPLPLSFSLSLSLSLSLSVSFTQFLALSLSPCLLSLSLSLSLLRARAPQVAGALTSVQSSVL